MKQRLLTYLRAPRFRVLKRAALLLRGVLFLGTRAHCPVCDWSLRGFTAKHGLLAATADGYCPRCNAKARHRRIWQYLQANTNLFKDKLRLLEVAPWPSLGQRLMRRPNIEYVGMDLNPNCAFTTVAGDLAAAPLRDNYFDAVLCVHVLEHVKNDRAAIGELFRVLKPGAWAVVSVPLLLDEVTREDPAVTSPQDRERLFGEASHVRYYGTDFIDRLRAAGFEVRLDPGRSVSAAARARFGLRDDENIFHCTKPRSPATASVD
ncbi:MAG: methyltransferase domain-containing protein [Gammaproteobacteria bacterium]|nr:methyltransferase domain-containing protein [Gammaproteobacteria bacterium]